VNEKYARDDFYFIDVIDAFDYGNKLSLSLFLFMIFLFYDIDNY